ncbi:MAG TPA: chalcone isomerase family protein [Thermoanaerobaculia bacterium]|nr:chalcone isomerase family protein [Thermoanaerobaculia bacterium]
MKYRLSVSLLVLLCIAAISSAVEVAGVNVPPTITVDGKTLHLNGAGLRTKLMFKVYVAGLYLENTSKDAAAIASSDQVKSMRLAILRSLKGKQVSEAIEEGFEKNSKTQMGALKTRLDKLGGMIPNVEKGDDIVLTYVPGKGTVVTVKGAEKGVVEGKDFADALFAVWLGGNPVQEDLKKELLKG